MTEIEKKISTTICKWQIIKAISNSYSELASEEISNELSDIFFLYKKSKHNRDLVHFHIAEEYLNAFDKKNIDVDDKIVEDFCKLLCDIFEEDLNNINDTFEMICNRKSY
ncbi:hypothetical protein GVAV_002212 [Gurleya vavrai]